MRALVISTNYGIEQVELLSPVAALRDAGADVTIAALANEPIQTLVGDKDPGEVVEPDTTVAEASVLSYDMLVVPGGTINADALRLDEHAVALTKAFAAAGKTIAAICHAPWLLVEAGIAQGKTLTSWSSVSTDVRNAGGTWVNRELVDDSAGGYRLITSRSPEDLEAFNAAITSVV
ncbi:type 1 glutamine amidotransferase domain-containing protein [Microbacterium indicum]|uniref:type 1 glutamine amidotransferase domain-containing protein n=1 Tax=Microbacterium indicum TaxID=358100 RepID=UPI00042A4F2B|nr:type 1 glutamine amidotransferase domain-containing protein [Microbacterium indicum]